MDMAGFYVRGHNLTRFRGSPRRILWSAASSLLAATGNDPSRLSEGKLFEALEKIRLGAMRPAHTS
jgi:hypothetical protein